MTDGFLRRWSRLKRQTPPDPQAPSPQELPPQELPPQELTEETPPDAETIPLDEVAVWLKRRVPQAWRIAALRRLWAADPAIAGFIGPADYQFDWEALGGSPGWGPLRAMDDIASLLSRAIGEPLPEPLEPPPQTPPAPPEPPRAEAVPQPAPSLEQPENKPEIAIVRVSEMPPPRRRGGAATPI